MIDMTNHDAAINDNAAVDRFAAEMKIKLAQARAKGCGGWEQCDKSLFAQMFVEHLFKNNEGNLFDLANLLMFYQSLGGDTPQLFEAVCEKIIAISTEQPAHALLFRVDLQIVPPAARYEVQKQLKARLDELKNQLGLMAILVTPSGLPYELHPLSERAYKNLNKQFFVKEAEKAVEGLKRQADAILVKNDDALPEKEGQIDESVVQNSKRYEWLKKYARRIEWFREDGSFVCSRPDLDKHVDRAILNTEAHLANLN